MEIAQALVCLARAHFFAAEGNHRQRGRPPKATNTWMAAVIVRELMDKHGATSVKEAADAALPDATIAELKTLERTFGMAKAWARYATAAQADVEIAKLRKDGFQAELVLP